MPIGLGDFPDIAIFYYRRVNTFDAFEGGL
jgi:hypothetical protein